MGEDDNRFGLSRTIPSVVKQAVRKRCGFGCVVCGSAIFDYEHVDPEFKDVKVHSADGIALLCPNHHRKKGKLLSDVDYAACNKSPKALETGFAFTDWSAGSFPPEIVCGTHTFAGGTSILKIGDELLLGFEAPEEEGAPPKILFRVFDRRDAEVFSIIGNEILCHNDAFDIVAVGPTWKVNSKKHKIDLVVRFDLPTRITIERMHFRHLGWELIVKGSNLKLRFNEKPVTIISGYVRYSGPCLYTIDANKPNVSTSDMVFNGGVPPSPIGTQPNEKGFSIIWPLYCLVHTTDESAEINDFNGKLTLSFYTKKSFADAAQSGASQIKELSLDQCRAWVAEIGHLNLIEQVALNPDPKQPTFVWSWTDFINKL